MTAFTNDQGHKSEPEYNHNPRVCAHVTLVKVEQSGINDVDTDVSIYTCSSCGKSFTITDF
jgi:hypothetical protein